MSKRTQIYLDDERRRRIDEICRREGKSLAQVVRDALDAYLESSAADADAALAETFGAVPNASVPPRSEWERRARRLEDG